MANESKGTPTSSRASAGLTWWDSTGERGKAKTSEYLNQTSFMDRLLLHPGRLSIAYLVLLISAVTALLLLPISTQSHAVPSFSVAFFTAVSAVSTCGITVVNTTTFWSFFGQVVILIAIQLGGLGVMTFASTIALGISRRVRVSQRILTANELGTSKLSEVKSVITVVLIITAVAELLTFLILLPELFRLSKGNVGTTLWQALFYAVSSYNNTGFTPDASGLHVSSWGVGLPILVSAFVGTLGFPVVLNIYKCTRNHQSPKRWSLHTKLTLTTTAILVIFSLLWFLIVEWHNAAVFPTDDMALKVRRALSAAVTPRSAGFDISWVPNISEKSKVFMGVLMFIGAGSSSTAGGIRVTTFAVIALICRAAFTGHRDVTAFRKRIPRRVQMTAISVTASCLLLVLVGALALMFVSNCTFADGMFDVCSAFSLAGYSSGVASASNPATLFILAIAMIVGRLGPMTIAYAISRPMAPEPIRYPQENIIVG